jgi:hypothetical protein
MDSAGCIDHAANHHRIELSDPNDRNQGCGISRCVTRNSAEVCVVCVESAAAGEGGPGRSQAVAEPRVTRHFWDSGSAAEPAAVGRLVIAFSCIRRLEP